MPFAHECDEYDGSSLSYALASEMCQLWRGGGRWGSVELSGGRRPEAAVHPRTLQTLPWKLRGMNSGPHELGRIHNGEGGPIDVDDNLAVPIGDRNCRAAGWFDAMLGPEVGRAGAGLKK